jgi:hypothetical protein
MPDESLSPWDRWDCARRPGGVAGKLPSEQPKGRLSGHGWPREMIMASDTQRAQAGYRRPPAQSRAGSKRTREDASIVGFIPLLSVLVVTIAGVYIAWRQGSAGGGEGGVIAGLALFAGAVARLLLPARLAGLLGTRKRATDVVTLTIFGAALLAAGLVLPR